MPTVARAGLAIASIDQCFRHRPV